MTAGEAYWTGIGWQDISVGRRLLFGAAFWGIPYSVAYVVAGPRWPYILWTIWSVLWLIGVVMYLRRSGTLRARRYWVVGTALVAIVTLVLAAPVSAFASLHTVRGMWEFIGICSVPLGLTLIIGGFLDHRLLVRSFASVARKSDAPSL
jgi:hypothetical protein